MFTVQFWKNKQELRVINLESDYRRADSEFEFLPEHEGGTFPLFQTPEEGWEYIRKFYPELQP